MDFAKVDNVDTTTLVDNYSPERDNISEFIISFPVPADGGKGPHTHTSSKPAPQSVSFNGSVVATRTQPRDAKRSVSKFPPGEGCQR